MTLSATLINQFLQNEIDADELPEPNWGPIGEEVYKRSYSRNIVENDGRVSPGWVWDIPQDGRNTEVWGETVRRVVLGNLSYAHSNAEFPGEATELFRLIYDFKVVPAGRHLWMTGIEGAALKNCHRAGWSKTTSDHFRFLAQQLFQGGGVGSNYSAKYRHRGEAKQGTLSIAVTASPDHDDYEGIKASSDGLWSDFGNLYDKYTVEDTREGWVAAWVHLINLAHTPGHHELTFDLSDIRPHGSPLRSFGGRASGPAPLAGSIVSMVRLFEQVEDRHLSAIESMKIDHYIASAIVAGGTRRSARMSQLNWDDPEVFDFIKHKRNDPSVSWSTNISVVLDEKFQSALDAGDAHACEVLHAIAEGMATDGEPGIYNLALASKGEKRDVAATNPCGEAILEEHYDPETGEGSASGESCNLGSVDLDAIGTDHTEALLAFELMSRFLYRATLAPVYDADQAEIEDRNRRLGVGLMGLQGWCASHGLKLTDLSSEEDSLEGSIATHLREKLDSYRKVTRTAADNMAVTLGLPKPIKTTAVAPTGTIAQLRGTTAGMHPVYARYFTRRVQYADSDPQLVSLIGKGYSLEDSVYAAHTKVVSMPVQDINVQRHPEELIEQADEVNVDQFLAVQSTLQATFCGGDDGQAISATANIQPGMEPEYLASVLRVHIPHLKGATVFPAMTRPQQPITAITREEYEADIKWHVEPVLAGDSNDGDCAGGACPIR